MPALGESRLVSGPAVLLQLTGTSSPPQSCILLGIEHGKMHVRTDKWIEPASQVTAEFARVAISGEIEYCTRKDNWYRACIAMDRGADDGRRDPRLPVTLSGKVITLSDNGSDSVDGKIHDLSVSGMLVELSHLAEVGSMIFVETDSTLVIGEVRHCHDGRNGHFEVGVEITDILPDIKLQQSSPGVVKRIRRKLAEAILGQQIATAGQ